MQKRMWCGDLFCEAESVLMLPTSWSLIHTVITCARQRSVTNVPLKLHVTCACHFCVCFVRVCSNLEKYATTLNKQSKQEPFLPQAGTALRALPAISAKRALP
jgi:hypothetical protein